MGYNVFIPLFKRRPTHENLKEIREQLLRYVNLLELIEQEDNREAIIVFIDCMQEIEHNLHGKDIEPLRTEIRLGTGDLKRIQEKCIRLGVV